MYRDKKNNKIKCFWCDCLYNLDKLFLHVLYDGSVTCPKNHIVGNEWDFEFEELISLQGESEISWKRTK